MAKRGSRQFNLWQTRILHQVMTAAKVTLANVEVILMTAQVKIMSRAAKVKEILNAAKVMATNVEVMMMAAKMLVTTPVMMLTAKAREPVPFYRFAEFS